MSADLYITEMLCIKLAEALRLAIAREGDYLAYADEILEEYDAAFGTDSRSPNRVG